MHIIRHQIRCQWEMMPPIIYASMCYSYILISIIFICYWNLQKKTPTIFECLRFYIYRAFVTTVLNFSITKSKTNSFVCRISVPSICAIMCISDVYISMHTTSVISHSFVYLAYLHRTLCLMSSAFSEGTNKLRNTRGLRQYCYWHGICICIIPLFHSGDRIFLYLYMYSILYISMAFALFIIIWPDSMSTHVCRCVFAQKNFMHTQKYHRQYIIKTPYILDFLWAMKCVLHGMIVKIYLSICVEVKRCLIIYTLAGFQFEIQHRKIIGYIFTIYDIIQYDSIVCHNE